MWISPCCFADIKFYIFNSTHCFADQKFRQKEVNLHQIDVGMSNIFNCYSSRFKLAKNCPHDQYTATFFIMAD
jgi:hypothetical protein